MLSLLTWLMGMAEPEQLLARLLQNADGNDTPPAVVDKPVVQLPAGRYRAEKLLDPGSGASWLSLRGVQYAQQPVGELRWQPPKPLPPSDSGDDVIDATSWGADCINAPWYERLLNIQFASQSESCLFLNVWSPLDNSSSLPVMFWMHGGSFVGGGSTVYKGNRVMLLRRDVVLVTVNYRLGVLGFLGGAAVARSSLDGSTGNAGLQDTREALRWVQRNIGGLRGDPTRITIFGESSGASFVALHLVAPRSAGLFSGAIMQSGAFDNYTMQTDAEGNFKSFSEMAGCNNTDNDDDASLACLRKRPLRAIFGNSLIAAISNASDSALFSPTIDGIEFNTTPEVSAARGEINHVQGILLGSNTNEGRLLMPFEIPVPGAPSTSKSQFRDWLLGQFSEDLTEQVMAMYPASDFNNSYWAAASKVFTDSQYTCPTRRSARWLLKSGRVPQNRVFMYQVRYEPEAYALLGVVLDWFEWCNTNYHLWICKNATQIPIGVGHAADVLLTWNFNILRTKEDHLMADRMVDWLQTFAGQFDPNGAQTRASEMWPPYVEANESMLLQPQPQPLRNVRDEMCNFWDRAHPVPYLHSRERTQSFLV